MQGETVFITSVLIRDAILIFYETGFYETWVARKICPVAQKRDDRPVNV